MYKILGIFSIGDKYCVSVEGNPFLLKNGVSLSDEKGNNFIIQSIGMVKYKDISDYKNHAELILEGDLQNIGETLYIIN